MKGMIFDIQRFSMQDGPGIRTTIFLKGCPLRCKWCANPESQECYRQVAHSDALCNNCGDCLSVCPAQAISLTEHGIRIDRAQCDNCTTCVGACLRGAIKVYGREMALDEVVDTVKRDHAYYRNTGGGVTASGGEPLMQPEFVTELFRECKALGIHTCLDTCGQASIPSLRQVLEYTDLIYFDLKLVDRAKHHALTGTFNDLILRNLRAVAEHGVALVVRVPLIPGLNSSREDIEGLAEVVAALPGTWTREVHILPYHRFGASKYQTLDRDFDLSDAPTVNAGNPDVMKAKEIIESLGLRCSIVV